MGDMGSQIMAARIYLKAACTRAQCDNNGAHPGPLASAEVISIYWASLSKKGGNDLPTSSSFSLTTLEVASRLFARPRGLMQQEFETSLKRLLWSGLASIRSLLLS